MVNLPSLFAFSRQIQCWSACMYPLCLPPFSLHSWRDWGGGIWQTKKKNNEQEKYCCILRHSASFSLSLVCSWPWQFSFHQHLHMPSHSQPPLLTLPFLAPRHKKTNNGVIWLSCHFCSFLFVVHGARDKRKKERVVLRACMSTGFSECCGCS